MHFLETLVCQTIEGFLRADEIAEVVRQIAALRAARPAEVCHGDHEPRGWLVIAELPAAICDLLDAAFFRRIEDIRRGFPSVTWPRAWRYVEYGAGQFTAAHADGLRERQIGGCNILLTEAAEGGAFVRESSGAPQLWRDALTLDPAADHDERLRSLPRTRWTVSRAVGTAIVYGCQVIHGTAPVVRGASAQLVCSLEADSELTDAEPRQLAIDPE